MLVQLEITKEQTVLVQVVRGMDGKGGMRGHSVGTRLKMMLVQLKITKEQTVLVQDEVKPMETRQA